MAVECHIVVRAERDGKAVGSRHALGIPLAAARGNFEDLSDRALNDLLKDLYHEQCRRRGDNLDQSRGRSYNPFDTQFTEES